MKFIVTISLGDSYISVSVDGANMVDALAKSVEAPDQLVLNSIKDNALEDWDFNSAEVTSIEQH